MCGLNTYLINNNGNIHSALTKIEKKPLKINLNDLFVNGPVLKKPGPFRKMTLINWFYLFNINMINCHLFVAFCKNIKISHFPLIFYSLYYTYSIVYCRIGKIVQKCLSMNYTSNHRAEIQIS